MRRRGVAGELVFWTSNLHFFEIRCPRSRGWKNFECRWTKGRGGGSWKLDNFHGCCMCIIPNAKLSFNLNFVIECLALHWQGGPYIFETSYKFLKFYTWNFVLDVSIISANAQRRFGLNSYKFLWNCLRIMVAR